MRPAGATLLDELQITPLHYPSSGKLAGRQASCPN